MGALVVARPLGSMIGIPHIVVEPYFRSGTLTRPSGILGSPEQAARNVQAADMLADIDVMAHIPFILR